MYVDVLQTEIFIAIANLELEQNYSDKSIFFTLCSVSHSHFILRSFKVLQQLYWAEENWREYRLVSSTFKQLQTLYETIGKIIKR